LDLIGKIVVYIVKDSFVFAFLFVNLELDFTDFITTVVIKVFSQFIRGCVFLLIVATNKQIAFYQLIVEKLKGFFLNSKIC